MKGETPPLVGLLLQRIGKPKNCLQAADSLRKLLTWYDEVCLHAPGPYIPAKHIRDLHALAETLEIFGRRNNTSKE